MRLFAVTAIPAALLAPAAAAQMAPVQGIPCAQAGGRDCVVGLWGANGHFAIARDKEGQYYAGFAATPGGAKRSVMGSCKSAGAKCKVVETLESMPYFFRF